MKTCFFYRFFKTGKPRKKFFRPWKRSGKDCFQQVYIAYLCLKFSVSSLGCSKNNLGPRIARPRFHAMTSSLCNADQSVFLISARTCSTIGLPAFWDSSLQSGSAHAKFGGPVSRFIVPVFVDSPLIGTSGFFLLPGIKNIEGKK